MSDLKPKKIREKIGQVFKIPLDTNLYGYGQVISKTEHVFFDFFGDGSCTDLEIITSSKVLFRITVDSYVIKEGIWPVIGLKKPEDDKNYFKQKFTYDREKNEYIIWSNEGQRKASSEEIQNLEPFASWEHKSVEQRIKDYIAGRPNYYMEYSRQKHKGKFPDMITFYKQYGYDFKFDDEA